MSNDDNARYKKITGQAPQGDDQGISKGWKSAAESKPAAAKKLAAASKSGVGKKAGAVDNTVRDKKLAAGGMDDVPSGPWGGQKPLPPIMQEQPRGESPWTNPGGAASSQRGNGGGVWGKARREQQTINSNRYEPAPLPEDHVASDVALQELDSFIVSLKDNQSRLQQEIRTVDQSIAEISEERKASAKTFVQNTILELRDASFNDFANLAVEVPQLTGQGLAYLRDQMAAQRTDTLKKASEIAGSVLDADGFDVALTQAQADFDAVVARNKDLKAPIIWAEAKLEEWKKTPGYALVTANRALPEYVKKIEPDSIEDYEPYYMKGWSLSKLVESIKSLWGGDSVCHKVSRALKAYGHKTEGRNAFSDIAELTERTDKTEQALVTANKDFEGAAENLKAVKNTLVSLGSLKSSIPSDVEILEKVRERAVKFMETPEFLTALQAKYSEDFPKNIPLLTAKIVVLQKVKTEAMEKMENLDEKIRHAGSQKINLGTMHSIPNMDEVRREHASDLARYEKAVTEAREGRTRATSYSSTTTTTSSSSSVGDFVDGMMVGSWMERLSRPGVASARPITPSYSGTSSSTLSGAKGPAPTSALDVAIQSGQTSAQVGMYASAGRGAAVGAVVGSDPSMAADFDAVAPDVPISDLADSLPDVPNDAGGLLDGIGDALSGVGEALGSVVEGIGEAVSNIDLTP